MLEKLFQKNYNFSNNALGRERLMIASLVREAIFKMKFILPVKYREKYWGHTEMSRVTSGCECPGCNKIRQIYKIKFGKGRTGIRKKRQLKLFK